MRRFRRGARRAVRTDPAGARDLFDLAARLGIPPEDAARQVSQLIDDANRGGEDRTATPVAPGT
jgi:hypothetical protein